MSSAPPWSVRSVAQRAKFAKKVHKPPFGVYVINFELKTYSKWNWKKCGRCRTISGHIFANCINIFHKTEVQKVILRCLRSLYLIWFKSHGTKCSKRPIAILAKSETLPKKLQLINGRFTTILGHFFADCMNIFHKTEVQAVIFRC